MPIPRSTASGMNFSSCQSCFEQPADADIHRHGIIGGQDAPAPMRQVCDRAVPFAGDQRIADAQVRAGDRHDVHELGEHLLGAVVVPAATRG